MTYSQMPRASVIIVSYNGRDRLRDCLASVRATVSVDCETTVVDNASTDGSAEMVEVEFPGVRLIRVSINAGFGAGNNLGVLASQGEYVVFINPDTIVEPGWLDALLAPLEANPHIGMATAKIVLADQPECLNTCGNTVHLTGLALCRGLGAPRDSFAQAGEVDAISGAAFAMRREVFTALGGFDADFFLYMEDTDLSWRARLAGWQIWYTPHSLIRHTYALRLSSRKVFYQERNRYLMLLKCLRWPTLLVLLPALLLAEAMTWGFVLWNDRANLGNKLGAYAWIITHWPDIMQKRQTTQALRQIPDRELLQHTHFALDFEQAAQGPMAQLARLAFTPLFAILKGVALVLVWW